MKHDFHAHLAEIRREQSARLRETYADFVTDPKFTAITNFFFDKIYDTAYKEERDEAFNKLYEKLAAAVGEQRITRVTMLKELNELTDDLDAAVTQKHLDLFHGKKVTRKTFEEAFGKVGRRADRERQVYLLLETTQFFHKLAHVPFLGFIIKPTKFAAKMMNIEHLMDFFMDGYYAFKSVKDASKFFDAVNEREAEYRERLFKKYGI